MSEKGKILLVEYNMKVACHDLMLNLSIENPKCLQAIENLKSIETIPMTKLMLLKNPQVHQIILDLKNLIISTPSLQHLKNYKPDSSLTQDKVDSFFFVKRKLC